MSRRHLAEFVQGKDFVSVHIGAKKVYMQKKLSLVNLREVFVEYKIEKRFVSYVQNGV